MDINIGDTVRYLDAVGGGVVMAFRGKDLVIVLEEDGFETPVLRKQCVVIETHKPETESKQTESKQAKRTAPITETKLETKKDVIAKALETRAGEQLSIFLAYLPCPDKPFTDPAFECYLINDSNYTLLFHYASCSGKAWKNRCSGELEANAKLFMEKFDRETICELEKICLQCIAFKPDSYFAFKNPVSVEIRLDTVKFYKPHCFRENDFFNEDALIVPIVKKDVPEKPLLLSIGDTEQPALEKMSERKQKSEPLPKKKNDLLEVDLHIASLLDTTAGMSSSDILQYQLDVFRRTMEMHQGKKAYKIVFIHGKGDGVLRTALLNELRTKYKKCKVQDASFQEYGFGASLVTIY